MAPKEWEKCVGEGGGCRKDVSTVYETGGPRGSREFRADLRIGIEEERETWLSGINVTWIEREGGVREAPKERERMWIEEGLKSPCTPTTAI